MNEIGRACLEWMLLSHKLVWERYVHNKSIEMLSLDRSGQCLICLLVLQYMLLVCCAVGPGDMYNNLDGCHVYVLVIWL